VFGYAAAPFHHDTNTILYRHSASPDLRQTQVSLIANQKAGMQHSVV